jgi:hypothetical protein
MGALVAPMIVFACASEAPADDDDGSSNGQGLAGGPTGGNGSTGAGSGSPDNVGACENYVNSVECGSTDISQYVDCSAYAGYPCDISGYFDCLATNVTCTNGVLDVSGMSQCASQATCN